MNDLELLQAQYERVIEQNKSLQQTVQRLTTQNKCLWDENKSLWEGYKKLKKCKTTGESNE